jgi:hypothetical protein
MDLFSAQIVEYEESKFPNLFGLSYKVLSVMRLTIAIIIIAI